MAWRRLHQRSRRLWSGALLAAFHRRDMRLHGRRLRHGVRRAPRRRELSGWHALAIALIAGILFGLGLTISHMVDPAKVLGFLDLAGDWDPSLALVMLGALAVMAPAYASSRRLARHSATIGIRAASQHAGRSAPKRRRAAVRIGWGLVGTAPVPRSHRSGSAAGGRCSSSSRCCSHGDLRWRQSRSSAISSSSWKRPPTLSERRSTP